MFNSVREVRRMISKEEVTDGLDKHSKTGLMYAMNQDRIKGEYWTLVQNETQYTKLDKK